jgi:hypothetical protein
MKISSARSRLVVLAPTALIVALSTWTPLFSNLLMLAMDRENFIPAESSVFSFEPVEVNQGSSNYWIYGQDHEHYFHFFYEPAVPYLFILKSNTCPGFDRLNVKTWCSAKPGAKS